MPTDSVNTAMVSIAGSGFGYLALRFIWDWLRRMKVQDQSNNTEVASLKMAQDMLTILRKELDDERGLRRQAEADLRQARTEYLKSREEDRAEMEHMQSEISSLKSRIESLTRALGTTHDNQGKAGGAVA